MSGTAKEATSSVQGLEELQDRTKHRLPAAAFVAPAVAAEKQKAVE